jgi:hypothetical protein
VLDQSARGFGCDDVSEVGPITKRVPELGVRGLIIVSIHMAGTKYDKCSSTRNHMWI